MIKLGLIQTRSFSSNEQGIEKVSKILNSLAKKETDVVCLPEQWLKDNQIFDVSTTFSEFKKIAKNNSMTIVAGAFYLKKKNRFSISAPIIGPSGEIIGIQNKIHPFGRERGSIKAGTKALVFKSACRFGVIICYDMIFPQVAHSLVKKGAQVLLSPSRIVRRGILPWHIYVQTRALENRIPILAANVQNWRFGGQSVIVDLVEYKGVMVPKVVKLHGQRAYSRVFNLSKYYESRKERFSDAKAFS